MFCVTAPSYLLVTGTLPTYRPEPPVRPKSSLARQASRFCVQRSFNVQRTEPCIRSLLSKTTPKSSGFLPVSRESIDGFVIMQSITRLYPQVTHSRRSALSNTNGTSGSWLAIRRSFQPTHTAVQR